MIVTAPKRIAPDVAWYRIGFVNVYLIGRPGSDWVLVDTGTPRHAAELRAAAEARHGKKPPVAIVLTHGHFDHSGNARQLAAAWGVPVYAHRLELPYLTGQSPYPPPDPLVGGFFGLASVFMPTTIPSLSKYVQELPEHIPGLQGWRWLHTPGHAPGQIALFRESDRFLIAGDAVATVRMDSLRDWMKETPELSQGVSAFNCDWQAAGDSVRCLAGLQPHLIAAGHGPPMGDPTIAQDFASIAAAFEPPAVGRYAREPARVDERGVLQLPPRTAFAWLRVVWRALATVGQTAGAYVEAAWMALRHRRAHR